MTLAERSRGKSVIMLVVVKEKRVSRQAREMEDLILSLMFIMTLTAAVEVNMSLYYSFVEIRIFDADFGASKSDSNPLSS
eukprot:scaffold12185_cov72-Skeletonema_marinoi.AAC.2